MKNKNHFFVVILLLISTWGCSVPEKKYSSNSVEIDSTYQPADELVTPKIEITNEDQASAEIGPLPTTITSIEVQSTEVSQKEKAEVILILDGGMRTYAAVAVFRALEKRGIRPDIIAGSGLGALIATLYSRGDTPDKIEWELFKFFKKSTKHQLYSPQWIKVYNDYIEEQFGDLRIQDMKRVLFIPLFNHQTKKIVWITKGAIRAALKNQFIFKGKGQIYFSPISHVSLACEQTVKLGGDVMIGVNTLGKDLSFEKGNEFLTGLFGSAISIMSKGKTCLDINVEAKSEASPVDSDQKLHLIYKMFFDQTLKVIDAYVKKGKESE